MDLNMYLSRTAYINTFGTNIDQYRHAEQSLSYYEHVNYWEKHNKPIISFNKYYQTSDKLLTKEQLKPLEQQFIERYKSLNELPCSKSIWETIDHWYNAEQIHDWFVENIQSNQDDCEQYIVTKQQLEQLLTICQNAINPQCDLKISPLNLVTNDESDQDTIKETIRIIKNVLTTTNFEKQIITYHSCW